MMLPRTFMESMVTLALGFLACFVDAITGIAIGVGVFAAVTPTVEPGFRLRMSLDSTMSEIRLTLGRWLALAWELALAADILRTVMIPTWMKGTQRLSGCGLLPC